MSDKTDQPVRLEYLGRVFDEIQKLTGWLVLANASALGLTMNGLMQLRIRGLESSAEAVAIAFLLALVLAVIARFLIATGLRILVDGKLDAALWAQKLGGYIQFTVGLSIGIFLTGVVALILELS